MSVVLFAAFDPSHSTLLLAAALFAVVGESVLLVAGGRLIGGRTPRRRRAVSPRTYRLAARSLFVRSSWRDALVLRLVGNQVGPVLVRSGSVRTETVSAGLPREVVALPQRRQPLDGQYPADRPGQGVDLTVRRLGDQIWLMAAVDLNTGLAWTTIAPEEPDPAEQAGLLAETAHDLVALGWDLEAVLVADPGAVARGLRRALGDIRPRVLSETLIGPLQPRATKLADEFAQSFADAGDTTLADPHDLAWALRVWTAEHNAADDINHPTARSRSRAATR